MGILNNASKIVGAVAESEEFHRSLLIDETPVYSRGV